MRSPLESVIKLACREIPPQLDFVPHAGVHRRSVGSVAAMSDLITPALASIYLMTVPWFLTAQTNWWVFAGKVAPMLIGVALALQTYGRFMGWPS